MIWRSETKDFNDCYILFAIVVLKKGKYGHGKDKEKHKSH